MLALARRLGLLAGERAERTSARCRPLHFSPSARAYAFHDRQFVLWRTRFLSYTAFYRPSPPAAISNKRKA